MLRSAVAHHLSGSGSFQVSLLDPSETSRWETPDVVIVSTPVDVPGSVVIIVSDASVEIRRGGRSRNLPNPGLAGLASLLLDEL